MKREIMLLTLLVIFTLHGASQAVRISVISQPLTSSISYKWDNVSGSWQATTKNMYSYTAEGKTLQVLSLNMITGNSVSRTKYVYNISGKLDEYYSQNWINGEWINIRNYNLEYNENGKTKSMVVTDWKQGVLVFNRRQIDYNYNDLGLNTFVQYQAWNGAEWENSAQEFYFYDDNMQLIRSESFNPERIPLNRIFYESNNNNQRIEMHVQNWSKGFWVDVYRDHYTYDNCGFTIDFVRQNFTGGIWVNYSRTEYFREPDLDGFGPKQLIAVCHKGHTIYISKHAVKAHLVHGDCLGKCLETEDRRSAETSRIDNQRDIGLQVWPNPATDRVSVKLKNSECTISRIEIADMSGNRVRVINTNGENEVTVIRGNLHSGSYVMRVIADQTYSVVVIFK